MIEVSVGWVGFEPPHTHDAHATETLRLQHVRVGFFLFLSASILPGLGRPAGGAGKSQGNGQSPQYTHSARETVQLRGSDGNRQQTRVDGRS